MPNIDVSGQVKFSHTMQFRLTSFFIYSVPVNVKISIFLDKFLRYHNITNSRKNRTSFSSGYCRYHPLHHKSRDHNHNSHYCDQQWLKKRFGFMLFFCVLLLYSVLLLYTYSVQSIVLTQVCFMHAITKCQVTQFFR